MIEDSGEAAPGLWIAIGPLGPSGSTGPLGYEAYAEVVHDPGTVEPPGAMPQTKFKALLDVLAGHLSTAECCFFGQWTVWGHLIRPTRTWTFDQDAAHARVPRPLPELRDLRVLEDELLLEPDYRYQLFSGPLAAASMVGHWSSENVFEPHAPDLLWPQGHAWCVRRDGDSDTVVAGGPALIHDILNRPELEARPL